VQKEFAQRLAAGSGSKDYGSLSCFVQYYAEPRIKFFIKNNSFFPVPKVDSAFIEIKIRQKSLLSERKEKVFFRVVRFAFNQRRKTLRNSLKGVISQDSLESFLHESSLDPNIRPEKLTLLNFLNLAIIAKIPK
jgi:16S rRNA (adenine1518-N6/adenine1519-N6)-dimethyltransferase